MKNDDAELIQRVLAGDDDAFSVLVKKYQKQVHALAWRKIGDFHIAEEITQDTFLKAYKRLATLKKPQRFVSWLYVIAANRCSSWLRKKRLWTQPLEELEETDNAHVQNVAYSGYVVAENEHTTAETQRDVVKKLLSKLQESERTIITLHYFGEMSCTEISTFLGVSANTIKSRLRRAQQRLKKEEPMIRAALDNFQITPNFTENVMREVARIKPTAPSGGKPFMPWAIAASTVAVVLLMLGIGNQQHAIRFQQPYSLDAAAEMTIELIEAPVVLNAASKPDIRTRIGSTNTPGRSNKSEQPPKDTQAFVTEAHADELVDDYTKWELPKEAKARLGKGGINVLQFSPDGRQLAVGSNIGVWLYDLKTGKEISMFAGMSQSLTFSPDGRFLASGGGKYGSGGRFRGKELQLWEAATGQKVALIDSLPPASALRFSEDSKTLLGLGNRGELISQLNIETRVGSVKNIEDRSWEKIPRIHLPEPYALMHDKFAVGGRNGKIQLWDTTTRKQLSTLKGHPVQIQDPLFQGGDWKAIDGKLQVDLNPLPPLFQNNHVLALAFSSDGTRLASGSKDTTVRLWDTNTGDELAILRKHTGWINVLAFSSDGKMLASGGTDKTVNLWNTSTGELLATLIGHLNGIAALSFSPDGSTLASGSTDGMIKFWNTETRTALPTHITGHTEWVKAVTFFKDSSTLASIAFNGVINFWDVKTSEKIDLQMTGHRALLPILAFSPDGTKLASVGAKGPMLFEPGIGLSTYQPMADKLIRLTDVSTGRELATVAAAFSGVFSNSNLTFSSDGKMIAFGDFGKIRVWNIEMDSFLDIFLLEEAHINQNGDLVFPQGAMPNRLSEATALIFSSDGKKLVGGTTDGKVQIWDTETGVLLTSFTEQNPRPETITALALSSNGSLIAAGSNKRIRLLGSHKQIGLKEIRHGVETLVFSPDSTMLVTGLRNGGIELWDLAKGEELTTLDGHAEPVGTLVFSPDGKTLVSTGHDGTILLWDWEEALKGAPIRDE